MKVRIENIEMVITHKRIKYQVGVVWTPTGNKDDTYEVYYYRLGVEEPIIFSWLVDSCGSILTDNPLNPELSNAIMDILFNEDKPMIKELIK